VSRQRASAAATTAWPSDESALILRARGWATGQISVGFDRRKTSRAAACSGAAPIARALDRKAGRRALGEMRRHHRDIRLWQAVEQRGEYSRGGGRTGRCDRSSAIADPEARIEAQHAAGPATMYIVT